ncbi:MAG: isoleucine--tRNA ligase, partial [Defluviitaleaceae bacterium]|nr:isoleucine--tRNA ligase [Defluviitaleaceae bacterium]
EVAQGYKELHEKSVIAQFKVKGKDDEYILAWTTTPWTLPSNVGLCVNANEDYVRAKQGDSVYILAKALAGSVLGEDFEIVEVFKGASLEHLEYTPLFDFVSFDVKSHYVVCDDYVKLDEGTGVVHQAPAFGEDDSRVARKYGLPFVQLINEQGQLTEETPWAGIFAKKADPKIIKYMEDNNLLYKALNTTHNYPHCWRCDTPLLYYARSAWFIEMTKLRDNLLANNHKVNWMPDNVKAGRFGKFLEGVVDWSLSRERYWGTPLPVWECECKHHIAIGSVEELSHLSGKDCSQVELHKPYIDEITIPCEKCGKDMARVKEVIDCWFDSGSMPFAQYHYPFENKEIFEQNFPADFISEAIDQTRGWFYTLMAISTAIFDQAPYKNVIVLGHGLDAKGVKMSKSKGNVVSWDIVEDLGADTVRWYFFSTSAPWLPNRFDKDAIAEVKRKFLGTLWNTYAFYTLYANIDGFNPAGEIADRARNDNKNVMDRWILSRLNSLIKTVDAGLDDYKITETSREISRFVDDLSNWYVRRSRERFWASGMEQDKIDAYVTLHTALTTLSKLLAPYIPFMAEEMYQNLVVAIDPASPQSVHLCDFPTADDTLIDLALEASMGAALSITSAGRTARNNENIKNRQPLAKMYINANNKDDIPMQFLDIVKEELNIKEISLEDVGHLVGRVIKPNLKVLGPRYGKILPKISAALAGGDGNALFEDLQGDGIKLSIEGKDVILTMDDVLVEQSQVEGHASHVLDGFLVILNTELTDELIEEGFVREVISKIQTMRKEADFEVLDQIHIEYNTSSKLEDIIAKNKDFISSEVLALSIAASDAKDGFAREWDINGEKAIFSIKK